MIRALLLMIAMTSSLAWRRFPSFALPTLSSFRLFSKAASKTGDSSCNSSLTIKEELMFRGYRDIVKRTVKLPNNRTVQFDVLKQRHESIVVFSWDSKSKTTTLVQEYHPGPEETLVGTVAGMYEKWKHADPTECAEHELEEEAQITSKRWFPLLETATTSMPFDKYSNNRFYPFLALDCVKHPNPKPIDEGECINILENVTYAEIMDLLKKGKMNVVSAYTCLLAFQKLDELGIDYK